MTQTVRPIRTQAALPGLYGLLLLSLAARVAFTAWEPPFDGAVHYDDLAPRAGAYWPMNLYLGGPGYLVSFVALAVFVVLLGRGRTAPLNLAAGALILLGGTVFSLAITAEALPFAYATDPGVLPEADGRALVETLNDHLGAVTPAIVAGTLAIGLGVLLTLVAGWVSRALPRPFVGVAAAVLLLVVAVPPGVLPRPATIALYLVEVTLIAALGRFGLRAASQRFTSL